MRRWLPLTMLLLAAIAAGITAGQDQPEPAFEPVRAIGLALPRSVLYDPNFERYAVVDAYGALMFVDALTYETEHVLYESGNYTDFAFSHDGRWFALTIGTRIELWDTQAHTLVSQLTELGEAISIFGPLTFSPDDNLLMFMGRYPAPDSIRRSEFDTQDVPWIWNLTAARNEGQSTFPGRVEAYQFFDYRNGFAIGPDNRIVAALPGRLHVLDPYTLDVLFEIDTLRYEQDPLTVLFSARDNLIYVRPVYETALLQIDTQQGLVTEIPLGTDVDIHELGRIGEVERGAPVQQIGDDGHTRPVDLLETFLGSSYTTIYTDSGSSRMPHTVTLIDLVVPPNGDGDRVMALLFVYNEETQVGRFTLVRPGNTQQMALLPDNSRLAIRRGDEVVEVYDIASGDLLESMTPALRGVNFYQWRDKNRVLSFSTDGTQIISDFERLDANTGDSLAQDLRYSRRFDRFFWGSDSQTLVTLSANEWRLWDINTGDVLQRAALPLRNSDIIATSQDGFRYLLNVYDRRGRPGRAVYDVSTDSTREVYFDVLPARSTTVFYSPDWERFLVVYSPNEWGDYYPGNEIALYDMDDGQLWFMAGDDLPYPAERTYGWLDNETVYITGVGAPGDQPERIFGADFAPSGLPQCLIDRGIIALTDEARVLEWERLIRPLRGDQVTALAGLLCDRAADGETDPATLLIATSTPPYASPTPVLIPGVPACLTLDVPALADENARRWRELTAGMDAEQIARMESLLCAGIGPTPTPRPDANSGAPAPGFQVQPTIMTMLIDAQTGERSTGSFTITPPPTRPIEPLARAFRERMRREPGLIALSPDEQLIVQSSLPGELVIYRLNFPYQSLLDQATATAAVQLATQQLIALQPSPTATPNAVGTARPTLTPTITPTAPPRSDDRLDLPQDGEEEDICPSDALFTPDALPDGFAPGGRLLVEFGTEDTLWALNLLSGERGPDPSVPLCVTQLNCEVSPNGRWLLINDYQQIYVIRPDGTDQRVLFGEGARWPDSIRWEEDETLVYDVLQQVPGQPDGTRETYYAMDDLSTDADPAPWYPLVTINGERAEILSLRLTARYAVVRTQFSTGIGPGWRYYTYQIDTGETQYFARVADDAELTFSWSRYPNGPRLFYYYNDGSSRGDNVFDPQTGLHYRQDFARQSGTVSRERRYRAFAGAASRPSIDVWDSTTGQTRRYCIPGTQLDDFDGPYYWSPDSRYIAILTPLADTVATPQEPHLLVLDTVTGAMVDYGGGVTTIFLWVEGQ